MNTFFLLRYKGDVTPCLKLSNLSAGNVKNDAPSKIWKSENAKQIRNKIKCCEGCLNTWGVSWSINSSVYPLIPLILKNPKFLLKRK